MEPVSMAVSNQYVTSITDINTIGIVGDIFASDTMKELTVFIENDNAVTLKIYTLSSSNISINLSFNVLYILFKCNGIIV